MKQTAGIDRRSDKYLLNTVDNALGVLELLASSPDGMDLRSIARGVGLPKATTFRLCYTLQRRGYIERDEASKKYRLDVGLLTLSVGLQAQLRLGAESTPILEDAAHQSGETVNIGVLRGPDIVIVNKAESPQALRMDSPIGGREPAHCTSMGKVLLASLPPDAATVILRRRQPLPGLTINTITDIDELLLELQNVRARGYALDLEETYVGLTCIGAPVVDHRGRVIAALSVSGPTARVTQAKLDEYAGLVREAAARLSLRLGYTTEATRRQPSN